MARLTACVLGDSSGNSSAMIEKIADAIVALSAKWTKTWGTALIGGGNVYAVLLSHDNGPQICIAGKDSAGDAIHDGNFAYGSVATSDAVICYAPLGGLTMDPGTGDDPLADATWCSDADSFLFDYLQYVDAFYSERQVVYVTVDDTDAHFSYMHRAYPLNASWPWGWMYPDRFGVFADPNSAINWRYLEDPADTELKGQSFMFVGVARSENASLYTINSSVHHIQYFTPGVGGVWTTGRTHADMSSLDIGYIDTNVAVWDLERIQVVGTGIGRKGVIHEDLLHTITNYARPYQETEGGDYFHVQGGTCMMWGALGALPW